MGMSIHISASDFEELKPVEAGIYVATVGKPIFHNAKAEGKFGYYEVPFGFEDNEGKNRILTRNFSLSPKAIPFLARLLKAIGLAPEEGDDCVVEVEDIEGEQCKIAVTARTWKDEGGTEHLGSEISKTLPV